MRHMDPLFLSTLVSILGVSALVVFILHKVKMPPVVGYLLAGVIMGPYGLGLVRDTHLVEMMAEIGVVLLLFTIGIEFSIPKLLRMKKAVMLGGGFQVGITAILTAAAAYIVTADSKRSLFLGFLVALSSTAVVLKMLAERGETDSPHGRIMTGILIFQDICVVPLMLITPSLAEGSINVADMALMIGKAVAIVVAVLVSARWVVPAALHQVVGTKSRELFMTAIMLLCLGIAYLTSKFGLSLSLGAFLAGLVISESEYSHQATSDILPFKDSFMGFFFVSVGMLFNIGAISAHCLSIAVFVGLIFGAKIITGTGAALLAGSAPRASVHAGLGLAQVGEFSFVLAVAGREAGLVTDDFYQVFLSSSVVTMTMTPFILNIAPSVSERLTSWTPLMMLESWRKITQEEKVPAKMDGHVIIIGFGLNGRNLARVLKETDIPYVVLEMNSDTVIAMKKKGEPIYYGDGTSREILIRLGIDKARLVVVAISDPASTRSIVSLARLSSPGLHIIVRTRYLAEVDDLKALGADEVISEEFETSIEIFSSVLYQYAFPQHLVLRWVEEIRRNSYRALRGAETPGHSFLERVAWLPEVEVGGYRVPSGSRLAGQSIGELEVRKKTGVTIIAVRRGPEVFPNPSVDFRFQTADILLFTGSGEDIAKATRYFRGGAPGGASVAG